MPDLHVSKCRSCMANVIFVPSEATGRLMILDAAVNPAGNVAVIGGKARVMKDGLFDQDDPAPVRFTDHHATCPNAAEWRRKKK